MLSLYQIKSSIALVIVAALSLASAACGSRAQANKKAELAAAATPQAVDVTTAPAILRNLPRFIEATGSLAADEQTDVAPTIGGRVVSVGVDLGSYVQKGQVIVHLDAADARLKLEQSQAALAQANQSYAAVQTARAAADSAKVQVEQAAKGVRDVVVYAPISGYVADRPADVGEFISTSMKVATIVRTNPLRVRIDIPEQSISTIHPGQSVSVSASSYPDRSFAGRVTRISPNVSAQSRTLTVEAEVDNSENLLKPGQFATIRVLLAEQSPAILVPARAVKTDGATSRVFVIKDGVAQERLVATGQQDGDLIEIKGNISADELVATSNVEQLSDGAPVRQ